MKILKKLVMEMPKSKRISRDEMYLRIAETVALRGTCNRLQVGAVIVKDGCIQAEGYVGAPSGLPHCTEVGCTTNLEGACIRTVHAEMNAIIKAAKHGNGINGGTMYCTHSPCMVCAGVMLNAGIVKVVYREAYRDVSPIHQLRKAGVSIVQMPRV